MKTGRVYLLLAALGLVLPYSQFMPFLVENGLDIGLMAQQLMANRVSMFFGLDVAVSAVVLVAMILMEGREAGVERLWVPVLATFTVGVSLGLPLYLYMKEQRKEKLVG
ncbi:DUF2834 domain-containing protein [Candidatus Bathyarchaeota archaeon]|nr:DUF2834 domain-containing protein [Candidatus Bathyarchaeota archaeon]